MTGVKGTAAADATSAGFGPADLHSANNLPNTGGANQTVAIVDAGDDNFPGRMVADVAADAGPSTGPAVYVTDTDDLEGLPGTTERPGWACLTRSTGSPL